LLSTLIVFGASVSYSISRVENEAWRARQGEAARNAAGMVAGFVQRSKDTLNIIAVAEANHAVDAPEKLSKIMEQNPATLEIVIVGSEGRLIANSYSDRQVLANLITIPQSQWFLQARQGIFYTGNIQLSVHNDPYLIMAASSPEGSVVASRIRMDILWDVVKNIHFGQSGKVIVITQEGDIIAHTNSEFAVSKQTLLGIPEFSEIIHAPNHEWSGAYTDFHGESVVAATAPVPGTDWIVITELPQSEAFASSRTAIVALGIEAVFLMLAASLTVARYARLRIAKPMEQLRDGTDRIGRGDLNYRIDMIRRDEIGQLATAFNSMAADLEKQQDNLQKAIAYEYETKRANELARSNAMTLALSKVAVSLENSSNSELILDTLGAELQKLGLNCAVVTIDSSQEAAAIKYVSYSPDALQKIEKLTGISVKNYVVPKRYWPGERILTEKEPIWYPKPREFLRRLFPSLPEFIADQAWKLLGIKTEGQICILPLRVAEEVIGAMPIWGTDLQQADSPVLAIFASQVAVILKNANAHENETRRANELARSNAMILALSKVAVQLESSSDSAQIFETVGEELKELGINSTIGLLDDSKQNMQIQYISVKREVIRWAEKTSGHSLSELSIPRNLWPTEKVVTEKIPYWDPNRMRGTLNMFPILPERLHKTVMKVAGIELNDPVCYLPLANEQDVLGVLAVWGKGLEQNDVSALSVLANQITTAIRNSQLYEIEIRRGREKEVLLKEIHHRVKNNLQIISSLLNLQAHQTADPQMLELLQDSRMRVRSMALIHEKLYQSQSLAKINFGEYIKSLSADLVRSYQKTFNGVELNIQAGEIFLELDQAIPCGLILNELMTNALKYAFPNGRSGTIFVELRDEPGRLISLRVADNGVGLPEGQDIFKSKSLGLQLVNSLVNQLEGALTVENTQGAAFQISFKY